MPHHDPALATTRPLGSTHPFTAWRWQGNPNTIARDEASQRQLLLHLEQPVWAITDRQGLGLTSEAALIPATLAGPESARYWPIFLPSCLKPWAIPISAPTSVCAMPIMPAPWLAVSPLKTWSLHWERPASWACSAPPVCFRRALSRPSSAFVMPCPKALMPSTSSSVPTSRHWKSVQRRYI